MRKHQKHHFNNSQTGRFVVTMSTFMHPKHAFQITLKKFCTKFWAKFCGCVLYSSATYIRINTVYIYIYIYVYI